MRKACALLLVLSFAFLANGCASKARAIHAGATEFSTESLKSIDMMDELVIRQTTETLTSQEEQEKFFADQVIHANAKYDRKHILPLLFPFQNRVRGTRGVWADFLGKLRVAYAEYGTAFRSLEKGSVFSAAEVEAAIKPTKKLTADIVALGRHWADHPAKFYSDYVTLTDRLDANRGSEDSVEVKRVRAISIQRQMYELLAAEDEQTKALVAQCYQSARVGTELTRLLEGYGDLSVDDITEALTKILALADVIPGLTMGKYQTKLEEIVGKLEKDEDSKGFLDQALSAMQTAAEKAVQQ